MTWICRTIGNLASYLLFLCAKFQFTHLGYVATYAVSVFGLMLLIDLKSDN